jgi:ABC-type nitrate/sulfonate/bicarbonate transport system substrate-binding protein
MISIDRHGSRHLVGALALLVVAFAARPAAALDKVNVARAVDTSFIFNLLEVGVSADMWKNEGIEANIISFNGDARMQQGFAAGEVDFGLGSGPSLAFKTKGAPATGIADLADQPDNMAIIVAPDSTVKSIADLKGKNIGVTTAGSLTDWLVRELSRQQGWGPDGIHPIAMGAMRTRLAAMKSGELAGSVNTTEDGYGLEEHGEGKLLLTFGGIVPHFHTHVIFARNELIEKNPDLVKRFLRGWFKTVAYAKSHKDETIKVIAKSMELSPAVLAHTFDKEMEVLSDDGSFKPEALDVLRRSFVELGILAKEPPREALYDGRFVPVKF